MTDGEWMSAITELADRPKPSIAAAPASAQTAEKVWRLAQFVGRLSGKVSPVLREHGIGAVIRRTWIHAMGIGQLLSWEIRRWRLQQRVSAHRGRP